MIHSSDAPAILHVTYKFRMTAIIDSLIPQPVTDLRAPNEKMKKYYGVVGKAGPRSAA